MIEETRSAVPFTVTIELAINSIDGPAKACRTGLSSPLGDLQNLRKSITIPRLRIHEFGHLKTLTNIIFFPERSSVTLQINLSKLFRHQGKTRTLRHNLQIASLLSFVAGVVNVGGFLAVQRLTTNVTGHFAFLIDEVFKLNFRESFIYFLYIFSFFLGSFTSALLTQLVARKNERHIYALPLITESLILLAVGTLYPILIPKIPDIIVLGLLFAMGLQNSLVTTISNAAVRTTHLTGLFTDLGIELSQFFFYKSGEHRKKLTSLIKLRLTIISFFFSGGIIGGVLYTKINLHVLIIAGLILIVGLVYDNIRFRVILLKRKYRDFEGEDVQR